jgi:hypothetical protein
MSRTAKLLSTVSVVLADRAVLRSIRRNPGQRLFEINHGTLNSHHSWATKAVVARLEAQGRVYVQRRYLDKPIAPRYFATR